MDDILVLFAGILLTTFALFSIFRLFFRNKYWEKQNVAAVEQDSILKQFVPVYKTIQDLQIELHNKFGRIYGFYERTDPVLSVADPELLQLILTKDFEYFSSRRDLSTRIDILKRMISNATFKNWRRYRVTISPTFSTLKIKKLMSLFADCSTTLVHMLEKSKCKENIVEVTRIFNAFIIDAVSRTALSTKLDSYDDPNNKFVESAQRMFRGCSFLKLALFNAAEIFFGKLSCNLFPIISSLKVFESAAKQIVQNRITSGQVKSDFLQLLIDASIENYKQSDHIKSMPEDSKKETKFLSKGLTWDEIYSQCVIFFLAGYRTTSTSLSIITYMLAVHQDVQDKVYQEIKSVLGENIDDNPSYEDIKKMKYLESVISETMRLYPPVARLERETVMDYTLGSTGIHLAKGVRISIPVFTLHRDPDFFPEPNVFNPDRFNDTNIKKIVPYSYMPFGAGPRKCIAYRYALIEMKVALVKMLCEFHIQKCPETQVPMEFHNGRHLMAFINILPKDIKVKMEPRRN